MIGLCGHREGSPTTEQLQCGPTGRAGLLALTSPLDRNDGSPPRSASAAADPARDIKHLDPRAEPELHQKVRHQQRDMMAGGAIDLDEIATPEILDPR